LWGLQRMIATARGGNLRVERVEGEPTSDPRHFGQLAAEVLDDPKKGW